MNTNRLKKQQRTINWFLWRIAAMVAETKDRTNASLIYFEAIYRLLDLAYWYKLQCIKYVKQHLFYCQFWYRIKMVEKP